MITNNLHMLSYFINNSTYALNATIPLNSLEMAVKRNKKRNTSVGDHKGAHTLANEPPRFIADK